PHTANRSGQSTPRETEREPPRTLRRQWSPEPHGLRAVPVRDFGCKARQVHGDVTIIPLRTSRRLEFPGAVYFGVVHESSLRGRRPDSRDSATRPVYAEGGLIT